MTFNASPPVLDSAFQAIRMQARDSKVYLQNQRALMAAPSCSALVPYQVIKHFAVVIPALNTWAATQGLVAYAQQQVNDPSYDIAAEFTAMRNAMVSARDGLIGMFPKDGSGFLLFLSLDALGNDVVRTFTQAQLAPAVSQIDAVIATIN